MMIYVNGSFKGKDLNNIEGSATGIKEPEWSDIATRFYQSKSLKIHNKKTIDFYLKTKGKRWVKEEGLADIKLFYKTPYWRNFNSFKKHIIKHNKDIKLLKPINKEAL